MPPEESGLVHETNCFGNEKTNSHVGHINMSPQTPGSAPVMGYSLRTNVLPYIYHALLTSAPTHAKSVNQNS